MLSSKNINKIIICGQNAHNSRGIYYIHLLEIMALTTCEQAAALCNFMILVCVLFFQNKQDKFH